HTPADHRTLHSFPTRRSSDLQLAAALRLQPEAWSSRMPLAEYEEPDSEQFEHIPLGAQRSGMPLANVQCYCVAEAHLQQHLRSSDRKSTRLNSSHVAISYAVF